MNTSLIEEVLDLSEVLEMPELTTEMQVLMKEQNDLFTLESTCPKSGDHFLKNFQHNLFQFGLKDDLFTGMLTYMK